MKYFAVALVASILGSALCASIEDRSTSGDRVLDLVNAAFAYTASEKQDPISIPDMNQRRIAIARPPIDVVLTLHNTELKGLGHVVLDNVKTDADALTASLSVVNPQVEFFSKYYEIEGTAFGRNVSGRGELSLKFVNASFSFEIQLAEDSTTKAVSILSLKDHADIVAIDVNLGDIQVEGMTTEGVKHFVEEQSLNYFYAVKAPIELLYSSLAKISLNHEMAGMTIEQVIQWLKENTPSSSALNTIGAHLMIGTIFEQH